MTNRLETIANRQRRTFVRDVVFASFVALGAFLALTTVSTAAQAASPAAPMTHVVQR